MFLKSSLFVLAAMAGMAGFVADTNLNVEYVKGEGDWNGPAITVVVIAIMSSISLACATVAWNMKMRIIASMCLIGFAASVAFSSPVSYARILSSINAQQEGVGSHNQKVELLRKTHAETKALRVQESKKGGCGRNCKALMKREQELLDQIITAGVSKGKSLDDTVAMTVPLAAVIALTCLMNGLFVFGFNGLVQLSTTTKTQTPQKKTTRRRKRRSTNKRKVTQNKKSAKTVSVPRNVTRLATGPVANGVISVPRAS